MQKTLCSIAALTPTLLVAGGLNQTSQAQEAPQTIPVQQLYASLQGAVCRNDWNQALQVLSPLIASPEITSDYRMDLVRFRYQLEGWRAARSQIVNINGCNGAIASSTHSTRGITRSGQMLDISVQRLYTAMRQAVCHNDWDGALNAIHPLMASPNITSDYRQQLAQFRHQLETWRAARSLVENISGCQAVAIAPIPEQLHSIDWAG